MKEEMNIDAQRAAVMPNVEVFENKKSYANVTINITFKAKIKVFNLLKIEYGFGFSFLQPEPSCSALSWEVSWD